jgi:hypothetical protein
MNVPARDIFFGKLIRLLQELGLEMHTPQRGETWVCKRRPKRPRFAPASTEKP